MRNSRRRRHFFGHQKKTNNKNEKDFPRSGDTLRLLERPPVGGRSRLTVPLLWPAARKIGSKLGKTRYKKTGPAAFELCGIPLERPLGPPKWRRSRLTVPLRTPWRTHTNELERDRTTKKQNIISMRASFVFFLFFFVVLVGEALRSTTR